MQTPSRASDQLIRDLYDCETAYSKAASAVYQESVSFLATELLLRGGKTNVPHYLACVFRGQDAYLSSRCVRLPHDRGRRAVATMDDLIDAAGEDVPPYYACARSNVAAAPEATQI